MLCSHSMWANWVNISWDSETGGGANRKGGSANLLFCPIFPQKLHENEKKKLDQEGGATRPCRPPPLLDPPMLVSSTGHI